MRKAMRMATREAMWDGTGHTICDAMDKLMVFSGGVTELCMKELAREAKTPATQKAMKQAMEMAVQKVVRMELLMPNRVVP